MQLIIFILIIISLNYIYPTRTNKLYSLSSSSLFKWQPMNSIGVLPPLRKGHSLFQYKNKVFLFGGMVNETIYYNDLFSYDGSKMKWENLQTSGDIPSGRGGHSSVIIGNKLWIYGGRDIKGCLSDLYSLDLDHFSWTKHNFLFTNHNESIYYGREGHSMVIIDYNNTNTLVVFGGRNQHEYLNDMLFIDITNESIKVVKNDIYTPYPRENFAMWVYNNTKIYVYGGYTEGRTLDDFFYFDLINFKWNSVLLEGDIPSSREGMSYIILGNFLILHSGCDFKKKICYKETYVFSNTKNKWKKIPNNGLQRGQHLSKMIYLDKKIILFGGCELSNKCYNDLMQMDIEEPCPNNCGENENKGICKKEGCFCLSPFTGIGCEIKMHCKNNCNSQGVCRSNGKCHCNEGFTGDFCENKVIQKNDNRILQVKTTINDKIQKVTNFTNAHQLNLNFKTNTANEKALNTTKAYEVTNGTLKKKETIEIRYNNSNSLPPFESLTNNSKLLQFEPIHNNKKTNFDKRNIDSEYNTTYWKKEEYQNSQEQDNQGIQEIPVFLIGPNKLEYTLTMNECPNNCNDRGICLSRTCFCQEEFTGSSCETFIAPLLDEHLEKSKNPMTFSTLIPIMFTVFLVFFFGTIIIFSLIKCRKKSNDFIVLTSNKGFDSEDENDIKENLQ